MKTANTSKTKPNETKAWFRSSFTPSATKQIEPIPQLAWPTLGLSHKYS